MIVETKDGKVRVFIFRCMSYEYLCVCLMKQVHVCLFKSSPHTYIHTHTHTHKQRYTVDAGQSNNVNASSSSSTTGPSRGKKNAGATTSRRLLPRSNPQQQHQHQYHKGIENMDEIHPLNEATILCNIEHRFRLDYIYTRTGPLLLALNPFKWLPIYGEEIVRQYHRRPYGSLPPHCYQEAEDAYQQLQQTQCNQSVVICGESGAGE